MADEREVRRQCALKKWPELIFSWKPEINIRMWIDECVDLQPKLDMLEDEVCWQGSSDTHETGEQHDAFLARMLLTRWLYFLVQKVRGTCC